MKTKVLTRSDIFFRWLAGLLPKQLVTWAFIRVIRFATSGEYDADSENEWLSVTDAYLRWVLEDDEN